MLALGGLILTLPLFATSITSIKISPIIVSPTDTLPDADTVLPITILYPFKISRVDNGVLAIWEGISSASANDSIVYYDLQYSRNAINYSNIARLDADSDSDVFSYVHRSPANGQNYYRLKMVLASGNMEFSDIYLISLDLTPGSIFPGIVDTGATLFIESPAEESGELNIYDMNGRLVYSESIILNENSTFIGLDFTGWHRGHYVVIVSGEQLGLEVMRFVKR